jgi:hypothetical protein
VCRRRPVSKTLAFPVSHSNKAKTFRLANLDHNLQVLLIEGGESNLNNPWVYRPGICK